MNAITEEQVDALLQGVQARERARLARLTPKPVAGRAHRLHAQKLGLPLKPATRLGRTVSGMFFYTSTRA